MAQTLNIDRSCRLHHR